MNKLPEIVLNRKTILFAGTAQPMARRSHGIMAFSNLAQHGPLSFIVPRDLGAEILIYLVINTYVIVCSLALFVIISL